METGLPNIRKLIAPLVIAVLFTVLTTVTWLAYSGPTPLGSKPYEFEIPVRDASVLYEGADVQTAGVRIGQVEGVALDDSQAVARISLESRFAPVREGAVAITRVKSLLGEGYIELAPGPEDAASIPEGGRLDLGQVRDNQTLDEVLSSFKPSTRSNVKQLFGGFSRAVRDRGPDINAAIGQAAPLTSSIGELMAIMDRQRPALGTAINRSGEVLAALADRQGELQRAVGAGSDVLAATASRRDDLTRTIEVLPPLLRTLQQASRSLEAMSPEMRSAIRALEPVVGELVPALRALADEAPSFSATFRALPALYRASRNGLPALERILEQAEPSLAQVYPTLRELIPVLQLLREVRLSLLAITGSVANVTNITTIGPQGAIVGSAGAAPAIWNETLSGWVRKLPTHRPNPYPAPGSGLDIARGGLKAYDCRHTGNPLYLPPVGSAPADCVIQGPWEFNGKTAYYPRLKRAPR